jgi:hypothetical protein
MEMLLHIVHIENLQLRPKMLKSRKAIYFLIPLNILIWGYFIHRIFSGFSETDSPAVVPVAFSKVNTLDSDSTHYELQLDYRDPFLKDIKVVPHSKNNKSSENDKQEIKPAKTPVIVAPKNIPEVKYLGLIKNTTSGVSTGLVSINGQLRYVKQNNTQDGIHFKSFTRDSLVAKWGKERIVAKK